MMIIVAEIMVEPDQAEAFEARLRTHAANSLADEGCAGFEVARDQDDPSRFVIWERYRDEAAIEAHRQAPYLAAFRDATAAMVKSRKLTVARLVD